jgi:hypothetical protein
MIKKIADLIFIAGIPTHMAWFIAREWIVGKTAPDDWIEALITIGVILLGALTFPFWLLSKLVDRWTKVLSAQ